MQVFPLIGFTGKKALDYYKDSEERLKLVDEIKIQGFVEPMEREFIRPDGTRFWGMHSAIKIEFEGFEANLATMVDTTELRQARSLKMEKCLQINILQFLFCNQLIMEWIKTLL